MATEKKTSKKTPAKKSAPNKSTPAKKPAAKKSAAKKTAVKKKAAPKNAAPKAKSVVEQETEAASNNYVVVHANDVKKKSLRERMLLWFSGR